MKDWFQGHHVVEFTDLNKDDRSRLRPIVGAVIAAMLIGSVLLYAAKAWAVPMYEAAADGAKVTLHDDDCKLTAVVVNLPKRVTWQEAGKTYEGCFGVRPDTGVVLAYFTDKTFVAIPIELFQKVAGA